MQQWEYDKLDLNDTPRKTGDVGMLNDAGREGWELVAITSNHIAYLKRQIRQGASAGSTRRKTATSE
jgi:hypothetical protein